MTNETKVAFRDALYEAFFALEYFGAKIKNAKLKLKDEATDNDKSIFEAINLLLGSVHRGMEDLETGKLLCAPELPEPDKLATAKNSSELLANHLAHCLSEIKEGSPEREALTDAAAYLGCIDRCLIDAGWIGSLPNA